jgi:hypothetical protein
MVVAGHRDSFFRPLRDVRRGDDIFVDTAYARYHYRVTSLRVVNARDVSVLDSTAAATLTLITCYPFWVFGDAPDRFIVRATRVGHSAATIVVPGTRPRQPARPLAPPVADDETLVRQAIERFRVTYNARLMRDGDTRRGGGLRFEKCEITLTDGEAAVACRAAAAPRDDREPPVWSVTLRRAGDGWAIQSVTPPS